MSVDTAQQQVPVSGGRLPLGVYLHAFSLFAMGSAEFLLAGVLPEIADNLKIRLSSAGALISTFAIGTVIGGPPFAIMTLRWPRRTTLVTAQSASVNLSARRGPYRLGRGRPRRDEFRPGRESVPVTVVGRSYGTEQQRSRDDAAGRNTARAARHETPRRTP
ncbi:hypothetical protein ACFLIM_29700 [Nonomuraea sp. M3C6]|uniref:Major Facilitator Superfamily protein n=1 Tax=Nonomuraea marmarensis TaxID=3351344 RepID=A0ABW7AJ96_9ACTN